MVSALISNVDPHKEYVPHGIPVIFLAPELASVVCKIYDKCLTVCFFLACWKTFFVIFQNTSETFDPLVYWPSTSFWQTNQL